MSLVIDMGIIYTENGKEWSKLGPYHVCKWEPVKAFYKRYKRTGFMRHNLVYLSVSAALQGKAGGL